MKTLLQTIKRFTMAVFDRILSRLSSIWNKSPQSAPAFTIRNNGPYPYKITIEFKKITLESGPNKWTLPTTDTMTLAEMQTAMQGLTLPNKITGVQTVTNDLTVLINNGMEGYAVIGIEDQQFTIPPDYLNRYLYAEDGTILLTETGEPIMMEG